MLTSLFFFSCQKELSIQIGNNNNSPDLTTKINSSVSGFVTDENDAPVIGATVQYGTVTTTTDKYGYFEVTNAEVVKNAAVVIVNKSGYFKGCKTYIAAIGKSAFFRIKLIPKTNIGTISSTVGGDVTLSNDLKISLPSNAVVNAATNLPYTGTINISCSFIDPVAKDFSSVAPGDNRVIQSDGSIKLLKSFGIAAIELTGSSGELLQILSGKKATVILTIPPALLSNAPASISLAYFDETNGLWKEQGIASKNGNVFVGEVSHFSFWDYANPGTYLYFDCTVVNPSGNPVQNAFVKISYVGRPYYAAGYGITNSAGYVGGAIPDTSQLLLEIFSSNTCTTPVYSQVFTTSGNNISLANITVSGLLQVTVSGTISNCNNAPVSNGYILIQNDGYYYRFAAAPSGAFNFTTLICNNPCPVSVLALDFSSLQSGNSTSYNLTSGNNNLGNLVACGTQIPEYVNYSINGTNYSFAPPDYMVQNNYTTIMTLYATTISGSPRSIVIGFTNQNIAANTVVNLTNFSCSQLNDSLQITTPIPVNITEYGNINQHISGNFSGTVASLLNPGVTYNVTCNFRMRRTQ